MLLLLLQPTIRGSVTRDLVSTRGHVAFRPFVCLSVRAVLASILTTERLRKFTFAEFETERSENKSTELKQNLRHKTRHNAHSDKRGGHVMLKLYRNVATVSLQWKWEKLSKLKCRNLRDKGQRSCSPNTLYRPYTDLNSSIDNLLITCWYRPNVANLLNFCSLCLILDINELTLQIPRVTCKLYTYTVFITILGLVYLCKSDIAIETASETFRK